MIIYPHDLDTPEITDLIDKVNEYDSLWEDLRRAHNAWIKVHADKVDELRSKNRPIYPTTEQVEGLARIADWIRSGQDYGDHQGYARNQDRDFARTPRRVW